MRRILLMTCGVLLLVIIGAIVLFTGSSSVRMWLAEKALRAPSGTVHDYAAKTLMATDPEAGLEILIEVARDELAAGTNRDRVFCSFQLVPLDLVEDLARILDDPDSLRAAAAAIAVGVLAYEHQEHPFSETIPGLTRALVRDKSGGSLRRLANSALGSLGQRARKAAPALLAVLKEGFFPVAYSLRHMELSENEVLDLVTALRHQDRQVRFAVAWALGFFKAHRGRITPALLALLDGEDTGLVRTALHSLSQLEQKDASTIRRVMELVGRDDTGGDALAFLTTVDGRKIPQDFVPSLLDLCRGSDESLQWDALQILRSMGPASRGAVPALREIADRQTEEDLKRRFQGTIQEMEAGQAVP